MGDVFPSSINTVEVPLVSGFVRRRLCPPAERLIFG